MTPQELQKQIDELKAWKQSLEKSYSIPLNIDQAFKDRFHLGSLSNGQTVVLTYVSGVSQDAGTKVITVTTKTATFTNGILTSST